MIRAISRSSCVIARGGRRSLKLSEAGFSIEIGDRNLQITVSVFLDLDDEPLSLGTSVTT